MRSRSSLLVLAVLLAACEPESQLESQAYAFSVADADWTWEGEHAGDWAGHAVERASDVDGDGFDDLLVGAHQCCGVAGLELQGTAYLFLGGEDGLALAPDWSVAGATANAEAGAALAGVGDVHGDGFPDVAVGVPGADEVWIFLGDPTGLALTPDLVLGGDGRFGESVAGIGDINADRLADVAIGEPESDVGGADAGAVHVFLGGVGGLSAVPDWSHFASQAGAALGTWVDFAGDVEGDGHSGLVAGAPFWDVVSLDEGVAFYWNGSPTGLAAPPDWTGADGAAGSSYGRRVVGVGDLDGDGFGELAVGAHLAQANRGQVWVYPGAAAGPQPAVAAPYVGRPAVSLTIGYRRLGEALATMGDLDHDGYADLVLAAPDGSNAGPYGLPYVSFFLGGEGATSRSSRIDIDTDEGWVGPHSSRLGSSYSVLDGDSDGQAELVTGGEARDGVAGVNTGFVESREVDLPLHAPRAQLPYPT